MGISYCCSWSHLVHDKNDIANQGTKMLELARVLDFHSVIYQLLYEYSSGSWMNEDNFLNYVQCLKGS